jgi:hypothetical protein
MLFFTSISGRTPTNTLRVPNSRLGEENVEPKRRSRSGNMRWSSPRSTARLFCPTSTMTSLDSSVGLMSWSV